MRSWQSLPIGLCLVLSTLSYPLPQPQPQFYQPGIQYEPYRTQPYVRFVEEDVASAVNALEAVRAEERLEQSLLEQASLRATRDTQELQRDRRAVDLLSGLLGSSSGGGGGGGGSDGGGGSGSGSILNLVGPLLGSSSGGSSGGGGGGDGESASAGGSDSGSILNLVGPLLGSSSGGGGGGGGGGDGGDAGSGSGSILSLIGPLLGSSSGGGGGGGDGGAGGSGLGSILGLSSGSSGSSSGGGSGGGEEGHSGGGAGVAGAVNVKFGIFTKLLNTISSLLAGASSPQQVPISELKYPDP